MTNEDMNNLVENIVIPKIRELLTVKGAEYAKEGEDRLGNFKRGAKSRGTIPEDILLGYVLKHDLAVEDFVQRLKLGTPVTFAMWDEKIFDRIIYNILLLALVVERGGQGG